MRLEKILKNGKAKILKKHKSRAKRVLSMTVVLCLLACSYSYAATTASSVSVSKVGYGVRDLTIFNPFTSCTISCNSSVVKGNSIKITFSSKYAKSKQAKGSFLHDGWNKEGHMYESSKPKYSWSIKKGTTKVASGTSTSYTFTPSSTGTYTVSCAATLTAKPSPAVAYVGITHWTQTKMPSQDFSIGAGNKSFTVKAPEVAKKTTTTKTSTKKTTTAKKTTTKKTTTKKTSTKTTPTVEPTKPSTPSTPSTPTVTPSKSEEEEVAVVTKLIYTYKLHRKS